MAHPLDFLDEALRALRDAELLRDRSTVRGPQGPVFEIEGREVLNFSSNDYLGLASHPELLAAARRELEHSGLGAGASRLITGDMEAHRRLEVAIAGLKSTEAALLFNSGWQANTGTIPALVGEGDAVFSDALNHASIVEGCRLSKAARAIYRHADPVDLDRRLAEHAGARRKLVVTDSLFSMDGDLAPLPEICEIARRHGAMVMVDEAHATGVFGAGGAGVVEHFGLGDEVHVQMGTLGKALGSFGAYVAGDARLVRYLMNLARAFVFTTALPPAICAASHRAIELVRGDAAGLRARLWENVAYFRDGLSSLGLALPETPSPIVPLRVGAPADAMRASAELKARGIWAHGIRPPTVPEGTSRIRTTLMATHERAHLDRALEAVAEVLGPRRVASGGA